MITNIILFFAILFYSGIVSQSIMYLLALRNAQLGLDAKPYIQLRKLIDANMRAKFKYFVYGALITNFLLVISTVSEPGSLLFITALVGFLALIADILLTIKGNIPINDIINTWSVENYPSNWAEYREKWLNIYRYRQIFTITGFVSLVIGAVFRGG